MCLETTILIADDDPVVRDVLARTLAEESYRLVFAEDGRRALRRAAEARPDLILLDVLMPELDGFEVCRQLRTDPLLASMPILMITALDDRRSRLEGLEAGADDFISKPFDDLELLTKVRTIVRLNRYRRLLESEERYRTLFETMAQGVVYQKADGEIFSVNPAAEEILGLTREEMQGRLSQDQRWQSIREDGSPFPGKDHPAMVALRTGEQVRDVVMGVYNPKREARVWINISAVPQFRPGEAEPYQAYTTFSDITARKQAQEDFKKTNRLLRATFASMDQAVFVVDADSRVVIACNPAVEQIFGYCTEEVVGRTTEFLHVDPAHFEEFARQGDPTMARDGAFFTTYPMRRRDGTTFLAEVTVTAISQEGWPGRVVSVVRDVTKRKRIEEQIEQHRAQLQRLSMQLIRAQEAERERLSRELHDELGQALTCIILNLAQVQRELSAQIPQTLRDKLAETRALVDGTHDQVRKLALDLRPSILDDLGLMAALRWHLNRWTQTTGVPVDLSEENMAERLPAELETALYRVIQEALTNVAQYAGAERVELQLERRPHTVFAQIADDGQGFDVDDFAAPDAQARGIGLLGMRERVTLLGGTLDVWSQPGKGTQLTVEVPVRGESIRG